MSIFEDKTAVITGAGSGIGKALALALGAEGCHLALSDVNQEGLAETQSRLEDMGVRVHTEILDVADREAFYGYAERLIKHFGPVQIVINNAGVSLTADLLNVSYEDYEWIFNINFWGMVYGSKAFLPHLLEQEEAWLTNISSIFGILAVPTQGTYVSTKFAIRGFTETLREELLHTKINVACVHPGGIKTNIARAGKYDTKTLGTTDNERLIRNFDKLAPTTAEQAAQVILQGMEKRKARILIGKDAKRLAWLQRLFPSGYQKIVARRYSKVIKKRPQV
ncbi:MAG: SDR family NAD(P)-dependent oxidoreductase [Bacteroidota bacterium]